MCIYTQFQYLCLHEKIKIQQACDKAVTDRHGNLTCPDDTNEFQRTFGHRTYGVGICDNINCAWNLSILPLGDFGDDKKFGNTSSFEDDTEINDSPEAREERVACWFRLLDTDQQLEHLQTQYPIPENERSIAGRDLFNYPYGPSVVPTLDTLRWQELNPLYLTPAMLQWCVLHRVLPASIVDDRKSTTICPLKPVFGPFKPKKSHKCPKKHGICKVCGENIGDPALKESVLSYRQNKSLMGLMKEATDEPDLRGTAFDPFIELKWDDEKGESHKVSIANDVPFYDAQHTVGSNSAFVSQMTQTLDNAALFNDQGNPFTDNSALTSMDFDIDMSMDLDASTPGGSLNIDTPASHDNQAWFNQEFTGTGDLSLLPQAGLQNDFSFDSGFSLGADAGTASANIGTQAELNLQSTGFPPQAFTYVQASGADTVMQPSSDYNTQFTTATPISASTNDAVNFSFEPTQHDMSTINLNPTLEAPHDFAATAGTGMTSAADSGGGNVDIGKLVDDLYIEWEITLNRPDGYSPETLQLAHQMLRNFLNGGVVRYSYDAAANALYETVVQHRLAGL